MSEYVYVDNSNVFIEGKRLAAELRGNSSDLDFSFRLDFGKLYDFVAERNPEKIRRALLLGSRPPQNDNVWNVAERAGFEVVVIDRNRKNQEKKIDAGIVDVIALVAGDSDYVPAVQLFDGRRFPS